MYPSYIALLWCSIFMQTSQALYNITIIAKECEIAFQYIYMNVSYNLTNVPEHFALTNVGIQFLSSEGEGNWTSGSYCNTSTAIRFEENISQHVRCRLFKLIDETTHYDIQLVVGSQSEITEIIYKEYEPVKEAFHCLESHDLKGLAMSASDHSVTARWQYHQVDRQFYVVSARLIIWLDENIATNTCDVTANPQIICTITNLLSCTHYNVCVSTVYNIGEEILVCRNITTTSTALRPPTGMKQECNSDQENYGKLYWQSEFDKDDPYSYFVYSIQSSQETFDKGRTRNTSVTYKATSDHNASLSMCNRCTCSSFNRIVLRRCQVSKGNSKEKIVAPVLVSLFVVPIAIVVVVIVIMYRQRRARRNSAASQHELQISPRQNGINEPVYASIDYDTVYTHPLHNPDVT